MKRHRKLGSILLAASLVPLLGVLAWLQISGVRAIGERERARLRQGLFAGASQLAAAFRGELAALPASLILDQEALARSLRDGDWSRFAEGLAAWKAYSLDPGLLAGLHLAIRGAESGASLLSWDGSAFRPAPAGPRTELVLDRGLRASRGPDPAVLEPGRYLLAVPLSRGPDGPVLILELDRESMAKVLLPALAERHLLGGSEYRYRIADGSDGSTLFATDPGAPEGAFDEPDLVVPLFRGDFLLPLRGEQAPNARVFVYERAAAERGGPERVATLRVGRAADGGAGGDDGAAGPLIGIFGVTRLAGAAEEPPEPLAGPEGGTRWLIEAVHREGSLQAAVRRSTRGSLALSVGVLVVLGAGLLVLAETGRRAADLADRRAEFVAAVSHELKTPLAVIRSAADNLADGLVRDGERVGRYGEAMRAEAERLGAMIESLLRLSRLGGPGAGRGRASARPEGPAVDLGDLARAVLEGRGPTLRSAGFRLDLELEEGPLPVAGEAESLRSAIDNLVSNVERHAASGLYLGLVAKRARRRGRDWALLRVDDRGPGLPRAERRLAFEAFYRGAAARDSQRPGSGVGLAIVRRVALDLGGSARFLPREEGGASVEVLLPLAELPADGALRGGEDEGPLA